MTISPAGLYVPITTPVVETLLSTSFNPEGMVRVRDALWRARTNRATPIAKGDRVRVVGVEGLVLQVEPLTPEDAPDADAGA